MALFAEAKEPFLRGFLDMRNGPPSHDTFSRLFRRLDPGPTMAVTTTKAKANITQFQMRNLEGEEELPVGLLTNPLIFCRPDLA